VAAAILKKITRKAGYQSFGVPAGRMYAAALGNYSKLRCCSRQSNAIVRSHSVKIPFIVFFAGIFLAALTSSRAATYYVDSQTGNDSNVGISPDHPWKTLEKVNETRFGHGDRILLHSGSRWQGQLIVRSSGVPGHPIVIDQYGTGPLPRIDGSGEVENTLQLLNVEQVEVRDLELTNHGTEPGVRRAVLVAASNFGTAHHIVISDLYIHDVNGTNERKETGGIVFRTMGSKVRSRFDGLNIERNIVWKVDRSAIVGESDEFARSRWFPSLHVIIRDNFVDDIGGDGIVPWATDGAVVEGNIALHCNERAGSYNAGIWPWSADNTLIELNEAAFTRTTRDSEGFDSDFNSRNTHFLFNYSHDNQGGFMLICTPVRRDTRENVGNTGTLIEYNISRDDHTRIFHLSGADQTVVANNAVYIGPNDDVQILLVSSWDGWSTVAIFRGNTFNVAGTGRFGHAVNKTEDGVYQLAPGWGGAKEIRFEGNRYFGHILDVPQDSTGEVDPNFRPAKIDWAEPDFDPARPEGFNEFLTAHRQWMLRLFTSQFGVVPPSANIDFQKAAQR